MSRIDDLAEKAISMGANRESVEQFKEWAKEVIGEREEKIMDDTYQWNEFERALRDIHGFAWDTREGHLEYTGGELAEVIFEITKQFFGEKPVITDEELLAEVRRRGLA